MSLPDAGAGIGGEPGWYKDAIIYELHVRAFFDSSGDGIGDFRGLTEKLDYIQDLGVTAIWILPFYRSPLKDDGYDIADYTRVHSAYGTSRDFQVFMREAHHRGLRVITELVLNHTSDAHPWFQRARRAKPGSRWRNFYVWSDGVERYGEARIIFKDFEPSNWTWDPVAKAHYWHRFYSHQPDLNFDEPAVRRAVIEALEYWLDLGVDGLRLDAVPYLIERDGTNCENLPETHALLKELRRHVDRKYRDRMLLAEANQWPEDARAYFGDGDECHMAFHFPLMPRLFMANRIEDRFPILDILEETPPIPEPCQWALFLRNHDELTLEMVTDEERDYMYRVYARDPQARINLGIRRRLAPLLANNRRRIELMNGLLFSLPGTPVLYYGDEIGMGDNIYLGDRNGVRTPMQWSADRNAGFSRASPQRLYLPIIIEPEYHYETINVEAQSNNPSSLLWWMKRLIALRKGYKALSRGTLEFLHPENAKVLAYVRRHGDETILVVANLSRFAQCVELDLESFAGRIPVEAFGYTRFPVIGKAPYVISLGPHSFYWFVLETAPEPVEATPPIERRRLTLARTTGPLHLVLAARERAALEALLPRWLAGRRWFGGKGRAIRSARIGDVVPMAANGSDAPAGLLLVAVEYAEGEPETYAVPVALVRGDEASRISQDHPQLVIALVEPGDGSGGTLLCEAFAQRKFSALLLDAIGRRRRFRGEAGEITAAHSRAFGAIRGPGPDALEPSVLRAEQSNTSVVFADRLILKAFRRLDEGVNPDLEIGRFLTERAGFAHTPTVAGWLEYRRNHAESMTLGILHALVPNAGDAWRYTLDALGRYFERVVSLGPAATTGEPPQQPQDLVLATRDELPKFVFEIIGTYVQSAELLGRRTAEMHVALASDHSDPAFAPEPFTTHYQQAIHQSMRTQVTRTLRLLRARKAGLPEEARPLAQTVLSSEGDLQKRLRPLVGGKIAAMRMRCHGDLHLGQVLHTGKDFVIIDFEGEPARSISERRIKRSPIRDVAGMLRSFHYAAHVALAEEVTRGLVKSEALEPLEGWVQFWSRWVAVAFLRAYLADAAEAPFLPKTMGEVSVLLDAFLVEKAAYELAYELNNRPAWVTIPLKGLLSNEARGLPLEA